MVGSRIVRFGLLLALSLVGAGRAAAQDPSEDEYEVMLEDAQRKLQKGELTSAEAALQEILDAAAEEPEGSRPQASTVEVANVLLCDIAQRTGKYEQARDGLVALGPAVLARRGAALLYAQVLARLGDYDRGIASLQRLVAADPTDVQVRYELADLCARAGRRAEARTLWEQNAAAKRPDDAVQLAYLGRSLWRLGGRQNFEAASQVLVDSLSKAPDRPEARVTLGVLKFDAYGEAMGFPSGEKDLAKVLERNGDDEAALLAMYRVRSANMALDGAKTERFLDRVLTRNPRCVPALMLRAANILDDRRYRAAAERLDEVLTIDPNDRELLCHRAAAAWLLHDGEGYQAFRARALAGDPGWPEADRVVADHLVALYRFADSLPFYAAALRAAPDHVPSLHGMAKALVYTGEGQQAKELLQRAKALEAGLVNPWRNNALAVQDLLDTEYTLVENDNFRIEMHRDDAEVLRAYLMPVALEAAEVLGAKYGYRPDRPVKVEAFHTWDDFSVRTIGFRGFTALGACFGTFITLVSPVDGDLRKQDFMWEATLWHEYTHVLTLGLSRNRVPRWLTEGFSVYEEKERDRAWERGMDRELFDAFANHDIPPVQLLNRLFRGPRILFGYYQGGLIVELIAKQHGFDKAIELLKAFGDDLDTEEAFQRALGISSAKFDAQLLQFVQQEKLRGMRLVPHFDDAAMQAMALRAARDKTNLQVHTDLAWGCLQRDNPVDAGRWLAEVLRIDPEHSQALLVRAELLYRRKDTEAALDCWKRGFAGGADDFDSRIRCGDVLLAAEDPKGAEDMWQRAKACWPGCTEQAMAPELRLAKLYRDQQDPTRAQMEMKAYCRRSARAFAPRMTLARFEQEAGNRAQELKYLIECNRIDPFHRELHVRLGEAYEALGKPLQAALEYEVGAAVLPQLDRRALDKDFEKHEQGSPEEKNECGGLWVRAARLRHASGDKDRARELVERVLREAAGSPAAADAEALQQDWQGR
jgi:tetratricopeptide (TPR) repeat protein